MSGPIHDCYMLWSILDSSDSITIKQYDKNPFSPGEYKEGIYVRVSTIKAKHHGKRKFEMLGKTDFDFLSKEEAEKSREYDIWVMKHKQQLDIPEQKIIRKGKTIWYNTTIIPWSDPDGVVRGVICIARDCTKRIEAQHRSRRLIKFLNRRIYLPLITLAPLVKKLGPEHAKLSKTLDEMLVRIKKLLLGMD